MAESEHAMIARLLAPLSQGLPGAFGLSDDAAALAPPEGCEFVVTLDTLIDGIHFLFDGSPSSAAMAAHKSLAVNVSDLAAKGAEPHAYLLSLALPDGYQNWIDGFASGLEAAQDNFGLQLAGGDTVRTSGPFSLTITAIGVVAAGRMIRRSGAAPAQAVFVSGAIGDAYAGLVLARGGPRAEDWREHLSETQAASLLSRNRTPQPRIALIPALRKFATASLDVSDGLAIDASRMAAASGLKVEIEAAVVPVSDACNSLLVEGKVDLKELLTGGDDYEVLATIPAETEDEFLRAAQATGVPVTRIGRTAPGEGLVLLEGSGKQMQLDKLGWDHLA